ncbi:MAG: hypothetical protein OXC25_04840 [Thiotrichales bacterium]|nr:hypothetical protein [Thiotrichales bacterium]MCY4284461.1 hypothetical protein [Thiotrichales bacterium]MCY4349161.1 hypothetical protein [Thiotrichales bacterium]
MLKRPTTPSQAEIDQAMKRGRQMRADAFGDMASWIADVFRRAFRASKRAATSSRPGAPTFVAAPAPR